MCSVAGCPYPSIEPSVFCIDHECMSCIVRVGRRANDNLCDECYTRRALKFPPSVRPGAGRRARASSARVRRHLVHLLQMTKTASAFGSDRADGRAEQTKVIEQLWNEYDQECAQALPVSPGRH